MRNFYPRHLRKKLARGFIAEATLAAGLLLGCFLVLEPAYRDGAALALLPLLIGGIFYARELIK